MSEAPPQSLDDKLNQRSTPGKARANLGYLSTRYGYRELEKDERGPTRVRTWTMSGELVWRRVSQESQPAKSVFEVE